jgi:hypothetical protein
LYLVRLSFVKDHLELSDERSFFLLIRLILKRFLFLLRRRSSALVVNALDPSLAPLTILLAERLHHHAFLELSAPLLIQASSLPLLRHSSQPLKDLSIDEDRHSWQHDVEVPFVLEEHLTIRSEGDLSS